MHPTYSPASPLHEASLVDANLHSPALLELLDIKISRTLIGMSFNVLQSALACKPVLTSSSLCTEYVVECTCETVDLALGRNPHTSGSQRPSRKANHQFVADLIHRAEVKIPVLLVALVYIDRARSHLEIAIDQYAFERVFLGGVILANKVCSAISSFMVWLLIVHCAAIST